MPRRGIIIDVSGDVFPRISDGVLLGATSDGGAAYDRVTGAVHRLNVAGAAILESCDGRTSIDAAVADWATAADLDVGELGTIVRTHLGGLRDLGLIERTTPAARPTEPAGSPSAEHGTHRGGVHRLFDHGIVFRSDDAALVERIDAHLGTATDGLAADLFFDVTVHDDGRAVLRTDQTRDFASVDRLVQSICQVIDTYAARTSAMPVLHAAGVRTPDGDVVLLAGPPGAGKSTLAAGCIAIGWDHLGDANIGLRPGTTTAVGHPGPLRLDAVSRRALGLDDDTPWPEISPEAIHPGVRRLAGDVGPIGRVVFVGYDARGGTTTESLEPAETLREIVAVTRNLAVIDGADFQTLCDLAERVPATRLTHHGVTAAVPALARLVAT